MNFGFGLLLTWLSLGGLSTSAPLLTSGGGLAILASLNFK
jgi:hypothetical protein